MDLINIFTKLNENQLARYFEPKPGIFVAESEKVISRALIAGYEPIAFLKDSKLKTNIITGDKPLIEADENLIKEIRGFELTGGILCAMKRKELPLASEICKDAKRIAVLEDVENPTNVGAIFRSAAAFDIDAILLTKDSADPLYRRSARVSMGNVFNIPWTIIEDTKEIDVLEFKKASMALVDNSISISDESLKKEDKLAILLGNENNGLKTDTINRSDYVVKIPMSHGVDSLNVAAASAVAFWELCKHA